MENTKSFEADEHILWARKEDRQEHVFFRSAVKANLFGEDVEETAK